VGRILSGPAVVQTTARPPMGPLRSSLVRCFRTCQFRIGFENIKQRATGLLKGVQSFFVLLLQEEDLQALVFAHRKNPQSCGGVTGVGSRGDESLKRNVTVLLQALEMDIPIAGSIFCT
jgi:hypothetical protein